MNQEPDSVAVSLVRVSRRHDVSELLLGSQVIEEWLLEVLGDDLEAEVLSVVVFDWSKLIVGNNARIVICFIVELVPDGDALALLELESVHMRQRLHVRRR